MQSMKKNTKKQLQNLLLQGMKEQELSLEEIARLQELLTEPIHQKALTDFFEEIQRNMSIDRSQLQDYIKRELRSQDYDLPIFISEMCKIKDESLGLVNTTNSKVYPNPNDPNKITLSCDELPRPIPDSRFNNNLYIVNSEKFKFERNAEESEKCLKLLRWKWVQQNQKQLTIIKVTKEINNFKKEAIRILKESHLHRILVELIDLLFTSKKISRKQRIDEILANENLSQINRILNSIQSVYSALNKNICVKQILKEIVAETNYSLMVQKKQAVNTGRVPNLQLESDKGRELKKHKGIIRFRGAKPGKSTTVNYLIGLPPFFKPKLDKYGQTIVFNDQKNSQNQCGDKPKTGTSQSISAQGRQ